MSDPDDVALLRSGSKDLVACDLSGAQFPSQRFENVSFQRADISSTHFANCTFINCDFTQAKINSTVFSQSYFYGCNFKGLIHGANLKHSQLEKCRLGGLVTRSRLDGIKFTACDVSGMRFQDRVVLKDAVADEATDFSGVQMPRSLSKEKIFEGYKFSRGALHKISREDIEVENEPTSGLESPPQGDASNSDVKFLISRSRETIVLMSGALASTISKEIANLPRPNEEEQAEFVDSYRNLLIEIQSAVSELGHELSELSANDEVSDKQSAKVLKFREFFDAWWVENGNRFANSSIDVGLIGLSTAFLGFCGAPSIAATAIAATYFGGKSLGKLITKSS